MKGSSSAAKRSWSTVMFPVSTYPSSDSSALVAKNPLSVERASGPG
ncbi:MAG TPA: hypothetical protein VI462_04435 [Acidimicrobiia bacterium]